MWEHLMTIHRETGHTLEHINLGGGIPVNYLRDRSQADQLPEHERDMLGADLEPTAVLTEALRVARESARAADAEHLLDQITILLEPGRSIIADAGLVLTTVRNIKSRPETGDVWLLTDAGYNIMLSMNNYKWYYHLISASRAGAPYARDYKVAGPLCDSGDVYFDIEREGRLPDYRRLPDDVGPPETPRFLRSSAARDPLGRPGRAHPRGVCHRVGADFLAEPEPARHLGRRGRAARRGGWRRFRLRDARGLRARRGLLRIGTRDQGCDQRARRNGCEKPETRSHSRSQRHSDRSRSPELRRLCLVALAAANCPRARAGRGGARALVSCAYATQARARGKS